MRLWHTDMIPVLPRQQLLGLHRETCALRGLAWGKKHSVVNYVFQHDWEYLFTYHQAVIAEMKARGYKPDPIWTDYYYRGKRCNPILHDWIVRTRSNPIYPEHTDEYKVLCSRNLAGKLKTAPPGKYDETEVYRFYCWCEEQGIKVD